MPLNASEQDLREAAAESLAKKLKLERRFIRELNELYREISADYRAFTAVTGSAPNADVYLDDMTGLHARQARRVSTAFQGETLDFLEDNATNGNEPLAWVMAALAVSQGMSLIRLIEKMRAEVRTRVLQFNALQVATDSRLTIKTVQKFIDVSLDQSRDILTSNLERPPTNTELAIAASRDFRRRGLNHSPTIAATFTQRISENTKNTEKEVFFNERNGINTTAVGIPQLEESRVWISQGDERVRRGTFDHVAADMDEDEGGIFTVSGEQLRFPGDRSLGASRGNTINCRCGAEVVVNESTVSAVTARGMLEQFDPTRAQDLTDETLLSTDPA